MRSIGVLIVCGAAIGLLEGEGSAQSKEREDVLANDVAMGKAIETGDVALYDKLAADDFQFITAAGVILTKAERLASLKKGPTPGFRTSDHTIRIYGNVAVVTGRQGPGAGPIRFTRVWVKQGDAWRAVSTQATSIQAPKP
jgi:hypothetical protein